MPISPFPEFKPGHRGSPSRVSAGQLNRLTSQAEKSDRITAGARGVSVRNNGAGMQVRDTTAARIYLQITGAGTGSSYPWQEVFWNGTTWQTFADGRTGTATSLPANEITGSTTVAVSTSSVAYEARLAPDEKSYLFAVGGGGGGGPAVLTKTVLTLQVNVGPYGASPTTAFRIPCVPPQPPFPIFYNSNNPSGFTIPNSQPVGGFYLLHGYAHFQFSSGPSDYIGFFKLDGDRTLPSNAGWDGAGSCSGHGLKVGQTITLQLNPGQVVEFCVGHNDNTPGVRYFIDGIEMTIVYLGT